MIKKILLRVGIMWKFLVLMGRRFWKEVVDDHVVYEGKDYDEIGIWGSDFNFFYEYGEGVVR